MEVAFRRDRELRARRAEEPPKWGYQGRNRLSHESGKPRQHWRTGRREKGQRGLWPLYFGGDEEDRTPGLGIANAALSQLSYIPNRKKTPRAYI